MTEHNDHPNPEHPRYTVSVKDLVEFTCRRGELGGSRGFWSSRRAQEGTRGHRLIIASRPDNYISEISLQEDHDFELFTLRVQGRLDGLFMKENRLLLEEIKTTSGRAPLETEALHLAQAKVYGHLLLTQLKHPIETMSLPEAVKERLGPWTTRLKGENGDRLESSWDRPDEPLWKSTELDIQITYAEWPELNQSFFRFHFTHQELRGFVEELVQRYGQWLSEWHRGNKRRDDSIQGLPFPFQAYRPGQRKLAIAVYKTLERGEGLLAEAPTGIGKTMAVLYPALRSMATGTVQKILFLTAKSTGRLAAENAIRRLIESGLRIHCLSVTAKDSICFESATACRTRDCDSCAHHFDHLRSAMDAAMNRAFLDSETLRSIARTHRVCPFELSMDIAQWSDVVICDYNYALDPWTASDRIRTAPFGNSVYLVDEAHNLVDRARDMFSAAIDLQTLQDAARHVQKRSPSLSKSLLRLSENLGAGTSDNETESSQCLDLDSSDMERWKSSLSLSIQRMEEWMMQSPPDELPWDMIECYFGLHRFLASLEKHDEDFRVLSLRTSQDRTLKHFCLDPARSLQLALRSAHATVYFSGTLRPIDYFEHFLGHNIPLRKIQLSSPFPRENLKSLICLHLPTTYRHRQRTRRDVADLVHGLLRQSPGNTLVFTSAYQYLESIYQAFLERRPEMRHSIQKPGMTLDERTAFIQAFQDGDPRPIAGFAVLGGSFSEGIDLIGDRLKGVIVVGVGMPSLGLERDLIRDHFERTHGHDQGFHYAYRVPGLIRVLQAAGRVIRSETDQGMIALIDTRYREPAYFNLLPEWWEVERMTPQVASR